MSDQIVIRTRTDLLALLAEAAELEHGIACSYLYAGFSLKRDLAEGGMTWEQQQQVRRWAAQIYFVASQEMLHLALVWNLTTAIGGTPSYLRPNFPQDSNYYPLKAPIALEPFGRTSLRRFILYEHPRAASPDAELRLLAFEGDDADPIDFGSIGELYALIASGFQAMDETALFIGASTQQMTPALVHFPTLIAVTDRESALTAVAEIVHQGEGATADRIDSHYGAFVAILREFVAASAADKAFAPSRPAMRNPAARFERGYGAAADPIDDPLAQRVAALFDSVYGLMLRMLAWAFEFDAGGAEARLKPFCEVAIDLMPRVLLPLGEGLMLMPAGPTHPGETAGPGFGLARSLGLPPDAKNAHRLCQERFDELAGMAADLAAEALPEPVRNGCGHLQEMALTFSETVPDE